MSSPTSTRSETAWATSSCTPTSPGATSTPDGLRTFPALGPNRIPFEHAELLLDDVWSGTKFGTSAPGFSPDSVEGTWDYRASCQDQGCFDAVEYPPPAGGGAWPPDRICDGCNVQFRMVSYRTCEAPGDLLWWLPENPCSTDVTVTGRANTIDQHIHDHCGIDLADTAVNVVYTGSLTNAWRDACDEFNPQGGASDDRRIVVMTQNSVANEPVLAHELGHILGLDHVDVSGEICGLDNLMCSRTTAMDPVLTPQQCSNAHATAVTLQNQYGW